MPLVAIADGFHLNLSLQFGQAGPGAVIAGLVLWPSSTHKDKCIEGRCGQGGGGGHCRIMGKGQSPQLTLRLQAAGPQPALQYM